MLKKWGLLLGVAAAAVALMATKKATDAIRLKFSFAGVAVKWEGITPILNLKFGISNVTTSEYIIQALTGDVYLANKYLGSISTFDPITIKPLGVSYTTVNLRVSIAGIVDQIKAILNKEISGVVSFRGAVTVAGVSLPVSVQQNLV